MTTKELGAIASKALEHWGEEPQVRQTMEECAELIVALNKSLRHVGDPKAVRRNVLVDKIRELVSNE